jgi:hypothetical protein
MLTQTSFSAAFFQHNQFFFRGFFVGYICIYKRTSLGDCNNKTNYNNQKNM